MDDVFDVIADIHGRDVKSLASRILEESIGFLKGASTTHQCSSVAVIIDSSEFIKPIEPRAAFESTHNYNKVSISIDSARASFVRTPLCSKHASMFECCVVYAHKQSVTLCLVDFMHS